MAALEILIITPAISNLIRDAKTFQIPSMMQTSKGIGMQTMNDALLKLVRKELVEPMVAYNAAISKRDMGLLLARSGFRGPWTQEGA